MEEKKIKLSKILMQNATSLDVLVELIVKDDNTFYVNVRNPQRQVIKSLTSLSDLNSYFQDLLDSVHESMAQNPSFSH